MEQPSPSSAFVKASLQGLDKYALISILKQMDPKSIVKLCSLPEFAKICSTPFIYESLMEHFYPGFELEENVIAQFKRIATSRYVLLTFELDPLSGVFGYDSGYHDGGKWLYTDEFEPHKFYDMMVHINIYVDVDVYEKEMEQSRIINFDNDDREGTFSLVAVIPPEYSTFDEVYLLVEYEEGRDSNSDYSIRIFSSYDEAEKVFESEYHKYDIEDAKQELFNNEWVKASHSTGYGHTYYSILTLDLANLKVEPIDY